MLLNYGFTELAYFELKLRRSPYFLSVKLVLGTGGEIPCHDR